MDARNEKIILTLHPKIRDEVMEIVENVNTKMLTGVSKMLVVQALRTFSEQDKLYAKGRTAAGKKVTNAKGGQSYHNYGLAIDFCLLIDGKEISWKTEEDYDLDNVKDWIEVVRAFVAKGYTWGKAFNDLPHFEKTFGYNWRQLQSRYLSKVFIPETNYVIL